MKVKDIYNQILFVSPQQKKKETIEQIIKFLKETDAILVKKELGEEIRLFYQDGKFKLQTVYSTPEGKDLQEEVFTEREIKKFLRDNWKKMKQAKFVD
jgi:hypothetical protein